MCFNGLAARPTRHHTLKNTGLAESSVVVRGVFVGAQFNNVQEH